MVETPAGWYPDPLRRFEHRYWDGTTWTEHVATAGQQQVDPPTGPPAQPATDATAGTGVAAPPAAATPAGGGWDTGSVSTAGTTNTKAIISLVLSILAFPATGLVIAGLPLAVGGIVLGFIARRELKGERAHERGEGLALAGIIVGFVYIGLGILALAFIAVAFVGGSGF